MDSLNAAFSSLLLTNMGLVSGERVTVFSDLIRTDEIISQEDRGRRVALHESARVLAAYTAANFGNASFVEFPATPASGAEPPADLWRAVFGDEIVSMLEVDGLLGRILEKQASGDELERAKSVVVGKSADVARVVIAMANNSTSHTRFRSLANAAGARFASLPHFDPAMFFSSMAVDWDELAARTSRLADAVNKGLSVILSTPAGTELTFSIAGRRAEGDDGLLTKPGSFGNLPAGEVYLAPLEGSAEGVLVVEYAPTRKLTSPLSLKVAGGEVVSIEGDDPHRQWLEAKFAQSRKNRNVAELGIGTNDRASRPDNVLEAEKILGTVHIALGDNSGFGGVVSTPFHEDYVLYQPTLSVVTRDGSELLILDTGRLLV